MRRNRSVTQRNIRRHGFCATLARRPGGTAGAVARTHFLGNPAVSKPHRRPVLRPLAVVLGLAFSLPLVATAAVPADAGLAQAAMLDARVNHKAAYYSALAGRSAAAQGAHRAAGTDALAITAAVAAFERTHPGAHVERSALTGAPMTINATRAPLTPASSRGSEAIVRDFLQQQRALYGFSNADLGDLHVLGDSDGGGSGLRMLRLEQRVDGRPVFQSETRFLLDRQGRLAKATGQLVPQARARVDAFSADALLSAPDAIVRLMASTGKTSAAASFQVRGTEDGRITLGSADANVSGDITAREVLFPITPGLLVPAWSLVVFTPGEADWYAVVDAETGDVLWRKNIREDASTHDARFRVYVQADGTTPADSPAPHSPTTAVPGAGTQVAEIAPTIVGMHTAMDAVASPNGWIDDCPGGVCTANETQTLGNNVVACLDRAAPANVCDTDANSVLDGNGRPTGNPDATSRNRDFLGTAPRDFQTSYLPSPQGGAGGAETGQTATGNGPAFDQFRRGAVTHLFYVSNWYHDKLFALGFDEASANFQQTNFSGMGLGGDRVQADAQDASGTNNANFGTPPDGTAGRMQMFRFTGPTIDRDGGLDTEIVLHELTHGTSNRLVGNAAGLNWEPGRGMGEGWSDFYALSLLNATNADDPDGAYASGGYATYKLVAGYLDNYVYGIRRFPYSTDNTVNPLTWADVDDVTNDLAGGIAPSPVNFNSAGGMEVHNSGELWALSLWEVRSRIIADPAGANGDVPTGNQTALQLVTDGLKMTPIDPTFLQARDALIDADCATNACANETSIWAGFADRGLGYSARAPFHVVFGYTAGHMAVSEGFDLPHLTVADAGAVAIDDSATNSNGAIDPGEAVRLSVTLTNPWRAASRVVTSATATLTSATPGVTIYAADAAYGAIAPMGTASGGDFVVGIAPSVVCGSSLAFTLTTTSDLGTTSTEFTLRVGAPNGTGAVVTYTRNPEPNIAIPDNSGHGVDDDITITDDFEIADLDLRIDSITHPFTGDLSFMLRSPDGLGVDLMSLIGGLSDGGPGDNIVNMVIDDDIASTQANDMVQVTSAAAPYTKSWLPVFNAPWAPIAFGAPEDPVGNLSRFDGSSTLGTWNVHVSDQAAGDTGTLNSWSLLVTPRAFACDTAGIAPAIAATKTVAGTFSPGGVVTYTVTLTNNGGANQPDNAGSEFTDNLPAPLTLISANATSGTASTAGNTVDWNGSLAPLGGSVTIIINATINLGTGGMTVANQGTAFFDGDGNGTNEGSVPTDDPGVGGATDPTVFTVAYADVTATKTVAGTYVPGETVTYTIVLSNGGNAPAADNTGDELVDVLPPELTLVSASATSGVAVANVGTKTATWNGAVPDGGSVTVTLTATIDAGTSGTVSNQANVYFDADLDGTNETNMPSDDPGTGSPVDATTFDVLVPVLDIAPAAIDFGSVPVDDSSAVQSVAITNTGGATLQITSIEAATAPFSRVGGTCATTVPFDVPGGTDCTIDYRFDPTLPGAAAQSIDITSNAGPGTIDLAGVGLQGALSVVPAALAFGDVAVGDDSGELVTTLGNTGGADLTVTALDAPTAPFTRSGGTCSTTVPFTITAGSSCTLGYTFSPTVTGAVAQTLDVTADVGAGAIALSGTGAQGELTVTATIDFGDQEVGGTTATQSATIGNAGDADLDVTAIEAASAPFATVAGGSCAAVPFTLAPGTNCTVDYTFSPTVAGAAAQSIDVASDVGTETIALEGLGTEAIATLSADALAFGGVEPDASESGEVTLGNSGDAPLTVTSISAPAAPFSLTGGTCGPTPFTLEPGESCTLAYTFAPDSEGAFASTVTVSSNGGALDLALTGTGSSALPPVPQPEVIPAASPWTLLVLATVLLLVAGYVVRRDP